MSELSDLIDSAIKFNWCTENHCTTCGAHQFKNELKKIEKSTLISDLRDLDSNYFHYHRGMFLTIIDQVSIFPMAGDLLEPLGDSPAGQFLRKAIEIQERRNDNRRTQELISSPEAVEKRKAAKREAGRLRHEARMSAKRNIKPI